MKKMQDKTGLCMTESECAASQFIVSLFSELNSRNVIYCVVGSNADQLPALPSNDIDIVVSEKFLSEIESVIIDVAASFDAVISQVLRHETCAYYYVLSLAIRGRRQYVKLDVCSDFLKDGRLLMPASLLLDDRCPLLKGGKPFLYLPAPKAEFTYYLIKRILKGRLDEDALSHLYVMHQRDRRGCDEFLYQSWPGEVADNIKDALLCRDAEFFTANILDLCKFLEANLPRRSLGQLFSELGRIVSRFASPTGFAIAVLGPDGSGKSTVLAEIIPRTEALVRQTRQYHLWPKRIQKNAKILPVTSPHALSPRGFFASITKLVYLVGRYNIGWLLEIFGPYRRSAMIWFDRYYHDMLADPLRYRMSAPAFLVRLAGKFIPQPDLFLVLDVTPEVARSRKTEVSDTESRRQFHAYRALAKELPNAVLIDANGTPEEVVVACEYAVVEAMAKRLKRRNPRFASRGGAA